MDRYTWPGCLPTAYVPFGPPALADQSAPAVGAGNDSIEVGDPKLPTLVHVPRPVFTASFDAEVGD